MTEKREVAERTRELLSLEGKIAVVTGGASGIGRGISLAMAEMGAAMAVIDIDDAGGRQTVAAIQAQQGQAVFVKCDVRSAADCRSAVDGIIREWDKIDILCNCAALRFAKTLSSLPRRNGTALSM